MKFLSKIGPALFVLALVLQNGIHASEPLKTNTQNQNISDSLLIFLRQHAEQYFATLQQVDSIKPYLISYRVNDSSYFAFSVNKGGVIANRQGQGRALQVDVRQGSHEFDNTHPIRDNLDFTVWGGFQNIPLPMRFDSLLYATTLKTATDFAYRSAQDHYAKLKANKEVRPLENGEGWDDAPSPSIQNQIKTTLPWGERKSLDSLYKRLLRVSQLFANRDKLYASALDFSFQKVQKRFVNTEGTAIWHEEVLGNIGIYVETKAEDGMVLWLNHNFFFKTLPLDFSEDTLRVYTLRMLNQLDTLRAAPVMETYVGPVILENVAAGVFTHEVFGHRVEGHRQKAVDEGQTFVKKVGQTISAPFISVVDDPSLEFFKNIPLNGYYRYDDEGVAGQKAELIRDGKFKGFLLGRSVLAEQGPNSQSNGHGRGLLGLAPVARMGNTILTSNQTVTFAELRKRLMKILKQSGKPFGLILHDISGGFTYTARDLPQSFRVEPLYMSQVFVDGRPDRIVRGVDAVGTPLVSLKQIVAAGDDPAVFNGYCGAESGWVPVSAVAPSLLIESMEFESRAKDQNLPPLLNPPAVQP